MNDEQCQLLVDSIKELTEIIDMGFDQIVNAIEGSSSYFMDGIESIIDRLNEST